jgi:hypothetical protein
MVAIAVVPNAAAEGRAQFFDDFDGDALAPHWEPLWTSPTSWNYQVANGLLTVNSLNAPSSGGSPTNYQRLDAFPPPVYGDFTATIVMGMGSGGSGGQAMFMQLAGTEGGVLGWFIFSQGPTGTGVSMYAGSGSSGQVLDIDPGLHEFTMMRTGSQMSFLLDGIPLATLAHPGAAQGVRWVRLGFEVEYPGGLPMAPMMVDRVSVIPAPTQSLLTLIALGVCTRRRRN